MGSNVWIVGVCVWNIINAIVKGCGDAHATWSRLKGSNTPQEADAARMLTLLAQMADVALHMICVTMPCPFCSKDSQRFLEDMEHVRGSVASNVLGGTLDRFVFEFHNKVNAKLNAQHLKEHGCASAFDKEGVCVVPPRSIKFQNYQLRLLIRTEFFTDEDLFVYLHGLRVEYNPALRDSYLRLFTQLKYLLNLQYVTRELPLTHPMHQLALLFAPMVGTIERDPSILDTADGFTQWLADLTARFYHSVCGRRLTPAALRSKFEVYDRIKVRKCTHDTCALGSKGQNVKEEPSAVGLTIE